MTKRVKIEGRLLELLKAKTGDENFDSSKVVAYESISASTRPIKKSHSPYDKAVMNVSVLTEAAAILDSNSVPLLVMHEGSMLPIGQCLLAEVVAVENGHSELRTVFYLEADSPHVNKIDLAIIDEVSVGMLCKNAYCSECDFDYLKPENLYNFWMRTCENDHVLGTNGVHLRLVGCDSWSELSLVNKGASNNAKIVNRAQQAMSKDTHTRIAASGGNPELIYLLCSSTGQTQVTTNLSEVSDMELGQLVTELSTAKAEVIVLTGVKTELTATNTDLTTKLAEANTTLTAAQAELATLKAQDTTAKLATTEAELAVTNDFLTKNWKLALAATGKEVPETIPSSADMIAQLEAAQVQLAAIPRNGVSQGLGQEAGIVNLQAQAHASAFQSKK